MRRGVATVERPKPMTLEQWAALEEDAGGELLEGVLEEEEVPSVLHELIAGWLTRIVGAWAVRRRALVLPSEAKIAVGTRRGRKADLSIFLRGRQPAPHDTVIRVAPHVVVEVVSPRPRDARRDRVEKPRDWARAGVPFYWILDPQLRTLEVFELRRDGRYAVAATASRGRMRVPGCAGLVLDLDALWREADRIARATVAPAGRTRR
jgi:Uma2 family endonuclease